MYFLIEDNGLLEKYNTIWDRFSADIKNNLIANLFTKLTKFPTYFLKYGFLIYISS